MRRLLLLVVLALLLTACATPPREEPDDREQAWQQLRAELEAVDYWRAEGRLALQSRGEGANASFSWREEAGDAFRLRLAGPWGQGTARLSGGSGLAQLETADGMVYHGTDAENLLTRVFGWEIPVDHLRRWLVGLPVGADSEGTYTLDHFGRLEQLTWSGWEVRYRRYRQVNGLDLPAELFARHEGRGVEVRLAVDRWRPGDFSDPDDDRGSGIPLIGD